MIRSDLALLMLAISIGLYIVFAPTPGVDCSHYTGKTFHSITVNCDQVRP